jgi:hypothetical protein
MMVRVRVARLRRRRNDEGAALILALAIVALLAFVAVAFATLTSVEVRASQNFRDGERARYAAWSGVERAKYELRRAATAPGYPVPWTQYGRYDYSTNTLTPSDTWSFTPPVGSTVLTAAQLVPPVLACLEATSDQGSATTSPSFGMYLATVPPTLVPDTRVGGGTIQRLPWPSGCVGASYYRDPTPLSPFLGDYYSLQVTDCNALIYLNDRGRLDQNAGQPSRIGNMIDSLAQALGLPNNLGDSIMAVRGTGFRRVEELQTILTPDQYNKLVPYLTCSAYVDPKVVDYPDPGTTGTSAHSHLTNQARAPIDINKAPYPVLVAALNGIAASSPTGGTASISLAKADAIARAIIQYRDAPSIPTDAATATENTPAASLCGLDSSGNPSRRYGFETWGEFKTFLTGAQADGTALPAGQSISPALTNYERSLVFANANPNTDLNKWVPDLSIFALFDKSDITVGTTEFCFGSCGVFQIDSLGVILGADGAPVAQSKVRSIVRVFERYVDTTQADFESDRLDGGDPGDPGFQYIKDITSLPESQNVTNIVPAGGPVTTYDAFGAPTTIYDGTLGAPEPVAIHAGAYDGQLTFNVITQMHMSESSTISANIDGTVKATRVSPSGTRVTLNNAIGTPTRNPGANSPGLMLAAQPSPGTVPDFLSGTDLTATANFAGRQGRGIAYIQADLNCANNDDPTDPTNKSAMQWEHHPVYGSGPTTLDEHVTQTFYASNSGGNPVGSTDFDLTESIADWSYEAIDRQGFEFWFKPTDPRLDPRAGPLHEVLLDWKSAPPQPIDDGYTDANSTNAVNGGNASTTTTVTVTAVTTNGITTYPPGPGNSTVVTGGSGGASGPTTVSPAPGSGTAADGTVTLVTVTTTTVVTFSSGVVSGVLSQNFGSSGSESGDAGGTPNWGAQAELAIWLDQVADPVTGLPAWKISCEFSLTKPHMPGFADTGFGPNFTRTWHYPVEIQPGTWHHALFSLAHTPPGGDHTYFYVDGNPDTSAGTEPAWPQEQSGEAQLLVAAANRLQAMLTAIINAEVAAGVGGRALIQGATTTTPFVDNDPVDVEIPIMPSQLSAPVPPSSLVYIGQKDPNTTFTDVPAGPVADSMFLGLVDNLIFQNDNQRTIAASELEGSPPFLPRFDSWRPSVSSDTQTTAHGSTQATQVVTYHKHAKALEWAKPVRILTFQLTAYKQSGEGGTDVALGETDLGRVYLRFGWHRGASGTTPADTFPGPTPIGGGTAPTLLYPQTCMPDGTPRDFPTTGDYNPIIGAGGASSGWTQRNVNRPFNSLSNGYLLPDRESPTGTTGTGGFLTRGTYPNTADEEYYYAIEMQPSLDDPLHPRTGPRMAPIVDDVTMTYMRWDVAAVIQEGEILDN